MSREISLSNSCTQSCTHKHSTRRQHTFIELRRFKNKLTEFLSIDDEHWLPAFEVLHQLDELIAAVRTLKAELDDKIVEKRLMYALNLQSDRSVLNIFKLANSDKFQELTCEDVALIMHKIDKARNPKASQIKALINNLMKEEKLKLTEQISQSFARFKDNEEIEVPTRPKSNAYFRQQYQQPVEKSERGNRDRRFKKVDQQSEREQRNNDLPTVKIDQIQATEGHFNVILKVIKIKKEFVLGDNKRKVEFEGGDETGTATVVVDSLRMIRPGVVIKIINAKVYSFHGIKQIQQNIHNSYLEQLARELRVNDNYNFSAAHKRREQRETHEQRQPRETRELRQPKKVRQVMESYVRGNRTERVQRVQRVDRQQSTTTSQMRREEQPRQRRNRDQNQRVEISRQQKKREMPKKEEQSGFYSDDQAEESEKEKFDKQPIQREKIESLSNSKALTKIKDIGPQLDYISLVAEIVSIGRSSKGDQPKVGRSCIFAVIGDQTGTIWAELPQDTPFIRENSVIYLKQVEVSVHEEDCKLILRLTGESQVESTTMRMRKINLENDMSQQTWQQQGQQEEEEQKPIVEDF